MKHLAQVKIGEEFGSPLGQGAGIGSLVSSAVSLAIAVAGVVLLFLLVGGGIAIIAGSGSDNPEQMQKGKQAVTSAIIGFIIVFVAYWIVRLIEVLTDTTFITAPGF